MMDNVQCRVLLVLRNFLGSAYREVCNGELVDWLWSDYLAT